MPETKAQKLRWEKANKTNLFIDGLVSWAKINGYDIEPVEVATAKDQRTGDLLEAVAVGFIKRHDAIDEVLAEVKKGGNHDRTSNPIMCLFQIYCEAYGRWDAERRLGVMADLYDRLEELVDPNDPPVDIKEMAAKSFGVGQ